MKSLIPREWQEKMKEYQVETKEVICEKCSKPKTMKVEDDGSLSLLIGCDCWVQEQVNESKKIQKQRMVDYYFNQSLINPELQGASFQRSGYDFKNPANNAHLSEAVRYSYDTAKEFCKYFSTEKGATQTLVIEGDTGTGKSFLAYSIARYLKTKGHTVMFIDNVELLNVIKTSFNRTNDRTEEKMMRMISEVDLLVLDDVGANKSTEWASEKLYDITNKRQGMNTIYTTNLDLRREVPNDIMLKRSYSRINNKAIFLKLDGMDRRMQG